MDGTRHSPLQDGFGAGTPGSFAIGTPAILYVLADPVPKWIVFAVVGGPFF